jgi:hypothetical protein
MFADDNLAVAIDGGLIQPSVLPILNRGLSTLRSHTLLMNNASL